MIKIYMFRHGETFWNRDKSILKFSSEVRDCDLTELGTKQAISNAEFLKDFGIENIYSSYYKRAIQTAKFLAEKINVDIDIIDGLQECNFYSDEFIGLSKLEIEEKVDVDLYRKLIDNKDDYLDYRMSKGVETKRESRLRFFNAVKNICDTTKFNIIAISTHGNILRGFLRTLNYENDSKLTNCEIIEINYNNKQFSVIRRIKNSML